MKIKRGNRFLCREWLKSAEFGSKIEGEKPFVRQTEFYIIGVF